VYYLSQCAAIVARKHPEKFWEMTDLLYEHQKDFSDAAVANLTANQINAKVHELCNKVTGMDAETYNACLQADWCQMDLKFFQRYGKQDNEISL
jgi:hypothetical protein